MTVEYVLRPRGYTWRLSPEPYVLAEFELTVKRRGEPVGGNIAQAVLRAPFVIDSPRERMHPEAFVLDSGWRVGLRNQFAAQPEVGRAVLESVRERLEDTIARGSVGRTDIPYDDELPGEFRGSGPGYWR